jgi:exodeoxyribonuclease VII small subunit
MSKSAQNFDLDKSLSELEKIVQELEKGEINLQTSLEKFERGVELYQNCRKILDVAEKKIQVLNDGLKLDDYQG